MKKVLFALVFAALAAAAASAAGAPMSVNDVVKLVENGIADDVIKAQIEYTQSYFSLSTDDLIKLKDARASDGLVNFMISRTPGTAAPGGASGKTSTAGATGISIGVGDDGVTVNYNNAGRTDTTTTTTDAAAVPKFGDLTVNLSGKYVVTSSADLNVLYAAFVDGEKKWFRDQWTEIRRMTTAETGASTTRRILAPGSFTLKVPAGNHTLTLVVWSGTTTLDDATAKSYAVYTKSVAVAEGAPLVLNLTGETDASGNFVVK